MKKDVISKEYFTKEIDNICNIISGENGYVGGYSTATATSTYPKEETSTNYYILNDKDSYENNDLYKRNVVRKRVIYREE